MNAPTQVRFYKYDVAVQNKSNEKSNDRRKQYCCSMRFKGIKTDIKHRAIKNILVTYEINEQTKSSIATTTACITESLQRHELAKWRIKKINKLGNQFFHLSKAAKLTLEC